MSPTNMNELKVIQLNINSLVSKNKRTEFNLFLKKYKPQIVMLSETKLNKKHKLFFDGYKTLRNDRNTNKGGGTAIIHQNNIDCEYITTPNSITSFECCLAKLKLKTGKNIILASIYKPPTEVINKKNVLIKIKASELSNILSIDKNAHYIIGGDFNSKHTAWNNTSNCTHGKNIFEWIESIKHQHNVQIYTSKNPTCKRSLEGSHIDFGFISTPLTNSTSKLKLPSEIISDHAAIFLNILVEPQTKESHIMKNYKNAKWSQMKSFVTNELDKLNVPSTRNITKYEIDTITTKMSEIYNEAIDRYIPNIKIQTNPISLSNQTLKLLKEKKRLLRQKHRNKLSAIHTKINNDLKLINSMIFNSIKSDYSKQMEQSIKNVIVDNNVFKNIKKIITYKKSEQMPNEIFSDDTMTEKYTTDTEKANAIATHFENIHKLTHKSVSVMEPFINNIYESYNCNTPVMHFSQNCPANSKDLNNYDQSTATNETQIRNHEYFTSAKEITEIIQKRNSKKTSGNDKSSNYVLKKMPNKFVITLTIILNHIINIHYIPEAWKFGIITAICKPKKDNTIISSYRPITQLSSISN